MDKPMIFIIAAILFLCPPGIQAQDQLISKPPLAPVQEARPEKPPAGPTDAEILQEMIEKQLADIRSFDISKAYYAYTTKEFQKNTTLEAFRQFIKQYNVFSRNKHVNHEKVEFNGNTATYTGKLVSVEGEVSKLEVSLIYIEEEWKIQSIALVGVPQGKK